MEITKMYKACVKAARVKGKASPDRILPTAKEKKVNEESFNKRAMEVITNISKLRDFLFTYQTEYLGEFSPLVSVSSKMSDEERQQIDSDAQTFIKSCSNAIASLKTEVGKMRLVDQYKAHSLVVLEILDAYLKDICKLYSQQRAFRVKQAVDRKRMSRLKPERSYKKNEDTTVRKRKQENEETSTVKPTFLKKELREDEHTSTISTIQNNTVYNQLLTEDSKSREEIQFTQEETQMFEEENERLYEEMNNIVKEVKNIEGKVVEISHLQEIFQEKVLSQAEQVECISETAVSTTEDVKEGNEQIREALKNSATFRVWILFFLVMCTFSLLFLDWYNE